MFKRLASATAMCSLFISTINKAEGRRVRSAIEPKFFSNFAFSLVICNLSLFEMVVVSLSFNNFSKEFIFLTAFLIVTKLVSIPPGQRSVTNGILVLLTLSATMSFACFFVATNNTFLPDFAICFKAAEASSTFAAVLCKSMM